MFNIANTGELFVFFLFSVMTIGGAVLMLSLNKVVHMVLSMSAAFIGLAGIFILLDAEFVAFVQVLIYVGAISILMIFGMMMTNHKQDSEIQPKVLYEVLCAVGALCLFGLLFFVIRTTELPEPAVAHYEGDQTFSIGQLIYTGYVIPFELLSVLLTVAFIGAIAIAQKEADE